MIAQQIPVQAVSGASPPDANDVLALSPSLWLRADQGAYSPGKALRLVATSSQYVSVADGAGTLRGGSAAGGWTLTFVGVPVTAPAGRYWLSKSSDFTPTTIDYELEQTASSVRLWYANGSSVLNLVWTGGTVGAGERHFFAFGWDSVAGEIWLSVDNLTRVTAACLTPQTSTGAFNIGRYALGSGHTNAIYDSVAFFRPGLTVAELTALYNGGLVCSYANAPTSVLAKAVSWWDFEDDLVDAEGVNNLTGFNTPTYWRGIVADSAVEDDDVLAALADQSGNAKHAARWHTDPVLANAQYLYRTEVQNELPALRRHPADAEFSGDSWAVIPDVVLSGDFSIFFTGTPQFPTTDQNCPFGGSSEYPLLFDLSDHKIYTRVDATTVSTSTTGWDELAWGVWEAHRTGSTLKVYRNGSQVGDDLALGTDTLTLTRLGCYDSSGTATAIWPFAFGESVVFDRYLPDTPSDLSIVRSWLRRWFPSGVYQEVYTPLVYTGGLDYNAFPSLLQRLDGSLYCSWFRGARHEGGPEQTIGAATSDDEGRTWSPANGDSVVWSNPSFNDEHNLGAVQLADGDILMPFVRPAGGDVFDTYVMLSTDGGLTFDTPVLVGIPAGYHALFHYGRLYELTPGGEIWMPCYGARDGLTVNESDVLVMRSLDGGNTWSLKAVVAESSGTTNDYLDEMDLCNISGGASGIWLAVFHKNLGGQHLWSCLSTDGGATWSVPTDLGFAGLSSSLLTLSSGNVLLVYGFRGSPPTGIRARLSRDGGVTFSDYCLLVDTGSDTNLGYPAPIQLPNGRIVVAYYEAVVPGEVPADIRIVSLYESDLP